MFLTSNLQTNPHTISYLGPGGRGGQGELGATCHSPPVRLDNLPCDGGSVFVVRDDFLVGGTKQRAAVPFLRDLVASGATGFVYASPFSGFAQIALAAAANSIGRPCTIVAEKDRGCDVAHEFTDIAGSFGADVILVNSLSEAECVASDVAKQCGYLQVPLGFAHAWFEMHLERELRIQWAVLVDEIKVLPRTLWLPLGSGTLTRVLRRVVPKNVTIKCVNVHVLDDCDPRIIATRKLTNVEIHSAPEQFIEPSRMPPTIPSNRYYDAKLWQFVSKIGKDGDVWWNVAR